MSFVICLISDCTGRYKDQTPGQTSDITRFYDFVVNGPARISSDGHLVADCFTSGQNLDIKVNAVPKVPGLYDPEGDGMGLETGFIDGKIFGSTCCDFPELQDASVNIDGTTDYSDTSASDGSYFRSGVVTGTYAVKAVNKFGLKGSFLTIFLAFLIALTMIYTVLLFIGLLALILLVIP